MMHCSARARLQTLLADHRPGDDEERRDRKRILQLVRNAEDPFDRTSFRPGHLTVSAIVLHPAEPEVALIFHAKLKRWLQPGGHGEPGETWPAEIARREVAEETGLQGTAEDGILDLDIHAIPPFGPDPAHEHFDIRLRLRARTDDLQPGRGVERTRWASLSDVIRLGAEPALVRAVRRALA